MLSTFTIKFLISFTKQSQTPSFPLFNDLSFPQGWNVDLQHIGPPFMRNVVWRTNVINNLMSFLLGYQQTKTKIEMDTLNSLWQMVKGQLFVERVRGATHTERSCRAADRRKFNVL